MRNHQTLGSGVESGLRRRKVSWVNYTSTLMLPKDAYSREMTVPFSCVYILSTSTVKRKTANFGQVLPVVCQVACQCLPNLS